jgi:predicted aspartyl protease
MRYHRGFTHKGGGLSMRIFMSAVLLAALLPSVAKAAEACGKLQLFDSVKLTNAGGGLREYIPVTINGTKKDFIFDTGGYLTSVDRAVAEELKLPIRQGGTRIIGITGTISRDQASVHEFMIGHMRGTDLNFPVIPLEGEAGLVALDHLAKLDVDVDFGTDEMKLILPDHCPGIVIYWKPSVVAVVPMTMDGLHIIVPVMLDGHPERALIDTGAPESTILIDESRRVFDLTMGSVDAPEIGILNGDASLKTYNHTFKTLAFGDVTVNNPKLTLIPNAVGRNMDKAQLVGNRAKTEKDLIRVEDMIIGMDVLRKLHIYIAFGERKMYVSEASASTASPATATGQ